MYIACKYMWVCVQGGGMGVAVGLSNIKASAYCYSHFPECGESGWCSSYRLRYAPLRPGINSLNFAHGLTFVSICLRGFFIGYSGFPSSEKSTSS